MSLLGVVGLAWLTTLVAPFATRYLRRFAGWAIAVALTAVLALLLSVHAIMGDAREIWPWVPSADIALRLRLDGLSLLFAVVVLGIGAIVMVYSTSYLRAPRSRGFYTLMAAFAAAMLTLVLADDLVVLFVAWELTTLCSYLLILRSGPAAREPATRTLIVTAAGGLSLLAAVVLVIVRTGTSDLTAALTSEAWTSDPVFATSAAVLVALAAMTKSAQFPFHAWLPDAMVAPAPVSAYLHAAAMVKAGIFLLLLFAPAASQSAVWPVLLISVGLFTAVMGGALAVQVTDLKKLLAYSTVSQLGLLVAVIGVGTPEAMTAATLHVVAHALFKSAAFMGVGLIERRTGTRDMRELSGLGRAKPWDAAMVVLAGLSMAGAPVLLGFVSKELVFEAYLDAPFPAPLVWAVVSVLTLTAILTVAYSTKLLLPIFRGHPMDVAPWRSSAVMSISVSTVALAGLALGPAVPLLEPLVRPAAADAAGVAVDAISDLYLWHGVNLALVLSLSAIVLGIALGLAYERHRPRPRTTAVTGVGAVEAFQRGIIRLGTGVGALTGRDSPAANLVVPIVLIALAVLALPAAVPSLAVPPTTDGLLEGTLAVIVACGLVVVVRAAYRLTAVIAIGVVGFAVVLWFFLLGASDVALTQLLVEILTVVVMIIVLRRMPRRFPRGPARRRVLAGAAAVASGLVATVATLVFTGQRPLSAVGEYFLSEAETETGGTNVVNTILVDFRAMDTLGELVVLGIGAVAITALLDARTPVEHAAGPLRNRALASASENSVFLRSSARVLGPVMVLASLYALLRGHDAPGGGFIAALIGAAALVLIYLSAPSDDVATLRRSYLAIAGAGILIAVGTGLLGFFDGAFLRPIQLDIVGYKFTTALVFDLGVYLAVLGVILAAVDRLGLTPPGHREDPPTRRSATQKEDAR
ncbi:DUF4040 family protein [Microbacterium sp. ACRRU]|uniref:DUF4040 family protein n=1 Tax=Microbacterium sp. ACRRU TaxID=2918204 RepID=UPI001EF50DA8|nr:DUF4040 family protein [Microbacterium sp. ACRRU]MCG7418306.1 DUF4040 family protein [Microbacterium sp. ACRRU]